MRISTVGEPLGTIHKIICPRDTTCPVTLAVDSGAFSAWTRGTPIDFKAYAKWLEANHEHIHQIINLDVIPGRPDTIPTEAEVDYAAKASWNNLKRLEKRGFKPMPVYHFGESRYWLERMIGEGYTYIGLGGIAGRSEAIRKPWLDGVFAYLCRPHGVPCVRVHGLGVTGLTMMLRYPWYSVDSVSYILQGAMGKVLLPRHRRGDWDYTRTPRAIHLTTKKIPYPADHIESQGTAIRALFGKLLLEEKISYRESLVDQIPRILLNFRVYRRVAKAWKPHPFEVRTCDLFDEGAQPPKPGVDFDWEHLRFYAGCKIGDTRDRLSTLEGYPYRLASFWDISRTRELDIQYY